MQKLSTLVPAAPGSAARSNIESGRDRLIKRYVVGVLWGEIKEDEDCIRFLCRQLISRLKRVLQASVIGGVRGRYSRSCAAEVGRAYCSGSKWAVYMGFNLFEQ